MHILKWAEENSLFLASAYDLSFVSWYQRPFYKETVNFGARTASEYFLFHLAVLPKAPPSPSLCPKRKQNAT